MSAKAGGSPAPTRRSRGSLSEGEIVTGAITLAERDGLENLSMPNLAKHLGAGVMSLYWYFHSKEDLLGAMAERTMQEVYSRLPPVGDGPWDEEIIRLKVVFRAELERSPLFAELCSSRPRLLMSRPNVMATVASRANAELRVLQGIGIDVDDAMQMHNLLSAFTVGFALLQLGDAPNDSDAPTAEEIVEASVGQLDPSEFPTLRAAHDTGALVAVLDADFDSYLRLIVAGMKATFGPKADSDGA